MILKETRLNFAKFITALTSGARTALGVAAATATAGIIVGVVTKTGLGLKMGNSLVGLAGNLSTNIQMQLLFTRSEEHTSELQSRGHLVCRLLLEKKKKTKLKLTMVNK